jgi:hypothetical protein
MNNVLRFKRGDLKKRAQQRDLLRELVFDVDADAVCDIEIITLQQHLRDLAMSDAWDMDPDPRSVDQTLQDLLRTKHTHAREFVEVENGHITIGVHTTSVDDQAVDRALMLLIQIEDITKETTTTFGELIKIYGP